MRRYSPGRMINRARDLLFVPGTARAWRRRLRGTVMAIVYHRVDDSENSSFLARGGVPVISPDCLADELSFLKSLDAQFLTLGDLRRGEFPGPNEFGVAVTFDDCFKDNYEAGLEVLNSVGVKATFFQCAAMIDGRELLPEHALYRAAVHEQAGPELIRLAERLGWPCRQSLGPGNLIQHAGLWIRTVPAQQLRDALREIRAGVDIDGCASAVYPRSDDLRNALQTGHEIGSHGMNHLPRATLTTAEFERELSTSRERIHQSVGVQPRCFSFPFNGYQEGDDRICRRYYDQVMTVDGKLMARDDSAMSLPRFAWPGPARNVLRFRRWLLTGAI